MIQVGGFTLDLFQERMYRESGRMAAAGAKRIILEGKTGCGKTVISSAIMDGAIRKGKECLFLAASRILVDQKSKTLRKAGLPHSILMDGHDYFQSQIVVASRQTFTSRCIDKHSVPLPRAKLLIVDEFHQGLSAEYKAIYAQYPDAFIVGLTATPGRADGSGLGHGFQIIKGPTHEQLVAIGRLVDIHPVIRCPSIPVLKGVSTRAGDYVKSQLSRVMNDEVLVTNIVENWVKYGEDRPTVVFTVDVDHSMHVCRDFNAAGIPCAHVDGDTPDDERRKIFLQLGLGIIKVITNCAVLVAGFDLPEISCICMARPTKSLVLYLQCIGRGLRSCPGKKDCLILDFAGAVARHGWPTLEREWATSEDKSVSLLPKQVLPKECRQCPKCAAHWNHGPVCPNCGWKPQKKISDGRQEIEGDLVGVTKASMTQRQQKSHEERRWLQILGMCAKKDKTAAQAAAIFHREFKIWPDHLTPRAQHGQRKIKVRLLWPGFFDGKSRK
jgi:DNA repair protein RadD